MRYSVILFFLITCLSCKTIQESNFKDGIPFDDTLFKNKEDEQFAIYNKLNSLNQNNDILVIFNGKKMSFEKFKKKYKNSIDSTFSLKIVKSTEGLNKFKIKKKYKALMLIDKKSL